MVCGMKLIPRSLLYCAALSVAAAVQGAAAGDSAPGVPVTASPPLQAVPTTKVSGQVQQRMRACNAQADQKQLTAAPRESFIKSCMAQHRSRHPATAISSAASAPATH